jgi:A/G-specific adenine glycosylase
MPWKGIKDPYKIWLSEIILQQTRVEQGWSYYEKFVKAFPAIDDLARAPGEKVFKLWEGLGYYSRCKNLIHTARYISSELNGIFPDNYEDILLLKGIGPYTAAAISSFAFNEPRAVVDGNVQRVLSRYFGISTPIDSLQGKKLFQELAQTLLDKSFAGIYNQAIMDFGAVVCKPQNPLCTQCVHQQNCEAFSTNRVSLLPVKEKRLIKKHRWFTYFIIHSNNMVYIRKRPAKDIWENLYEFVLQEEAGSEVSPDLFLKSLFGKKNFSIDHISKVYKQQLSHQTIQGRFIVVKTDETVKNLEAYILIDKEELSHYPFPKFINSFLSERPA